MAIAQLYTQREVADKLGVGVGTLAKARGNKDLPFIRLGNRVYFTEWQINTFLEKLSGGPVTAE